MNESKKNSGFVVLMVIVALAVVFMIASAVMMISYSSSEPQSSSSSARKEKSRKDNASRGMTFSFGKNGRKKEVSHSGDYVARLYITGTIENANNSYNQEWLLETIGELAEDEENKGIILFINSPGGGVYQSDEVYLKLLEYREHKPVYAYMGPLAASGGYYIACASSYIMANRNTLTGSIGVISGQFMDLTGLMEKYGVKSETIHAGRNKNMGNMNEPVTDEQRQIMQSVADECYEQFTDIVSKSRGMDIMKVRNLADGRIYTANQALGNGLIDAVGSWEEVVEAMESKEFEGESYEVVDFKYEKQENFYRYLLGGMSRFAGLKGAAVSPLPAVLEDAVTPKTPFPAYFYEME